MENQVFTVCLVEADSKHLVNLRTKFCCIAPEEGNVSRNPLQGFNNRFLMFWIIEVTWTLLA